VKKSKLYLALAGLGLCLPGLVANAADHADSPSQRGSELAMQADINDIYAFMNPNDATELVLVMTVFPEATAESTFSSVVDYDFLIQNFNGATAGDHHRISCSFPTAAEITCTHGDLTVSGAVGETITGDGMRVYSGLRDDPFYFNAEGFNATINSGPPATPMFEVDTDSRINDFGPDENILGLVIGINTNRVTNNQANPLLRIWAATQSTQ